MPGQLTSEQIDGDHDHGRAGDPGFHVHSRIFPPTPPYHKSLFSGNPQHNKPNRFVLDELGGGRNNVGRKRVTFLKLFD